MTMNLRQFLSISAQLSLQACKIIKSSSTDTACKKYLKGQDDPVTDADFKIQSMLIKGLNTYFPKLRIIGEETQEYKEKIDINYHNLIQDFLPTSSNIQAELSYEQSCVWIDPIDCTRGFINGNIEDVTILIGLSNKNKPLAGIIGTAFVKIDDKKQFQPIVTIGSVNQRETYDLINNKWVKKQAKATNNPLIIATSNTRRSEAQVRFLRQLSAKDVRAGGSGRKIMMVANGQADAMIYLDSWTHKWDSCAGDAIIKSMGGYFTNPFGTNITYNPDIGTTYNKQGMIVAMDKRVYNKCLDVMGFF